MKKFNTYSGRTMVEMLGVLAIIGILSIAGIMGFRNAMNKHRANETVDRLTKRAVVISSQRLLGQNAVLSDFDENDGAYPISNFVEITDAESFRLTVDDVPEEVCRQITALNWTTTKMIPQDCSDTTLKFKFLNDLSDCSECSEDSIDCSQYGTECGKCSVVKGFTPNDEQCTDSEKPWCVRGKCDTCEAGQYWGSYKQRCLVCSDLGTDYQCAQSDQADKCYGDGFYSSYFGQCGPSMVSCDHTTESIGRGDAESCKACPNRCYSANGTCNLFGSNKASVGKDANGLCICNTEIGAFEAGNQCRWCDENYFFNRYNNSGCVQCGSGDYQTYSIHAHKCLGSGFYQYNNNDYNNGSMPPCSQEVSSSNKADGWWNSAVKTDEESCKACENSAGTKNRCYNAMKGSCPLTGDDKPYLRNVDGSCSCNTTIGAFMFQNDCRKCPENQFIDTYGGSCKSCAGASHFAVDEEKHKCLGIAYYRAYKDGQKHSNGDGEMKDCSESGEWPTTMLADETSCTACANRCYLNGACYLAGSDKTYRRTSKTDGTCVAN